MRETTGSTWTFQLVIVFIFLFVSFLTVTISYAKSFKVRNEMTSIIEKYGGYNTTSREIIDSYIEANGYRNMGRCIYNEGDNMIGIDSLSPGTPVIQITSANKKKEFYYCVKKERIYNGTISNVYYEVTLFYKFNLPGLGGALGGNMGTFRIRGKSTDMTSPRNDLFKMMGVGL